MDGLPGPLAEVSGKTISSFADMKEALRTRMAYFHENGCRLSDHALEYVMYVPADEKTVEAIFAKRLSGEQVTREEELTYKTAFMALWAGNTKSWIGPCSSTMDASGTTTDRCPSPGAGYRL